MNVPLLGFQKEMNLFPAAASLSSHKMMNPNISKL